MSRTASQIRDIVVGRIGGRATGQIGGRGVDDVILDAINDSILKISKRNNIPDIRTSATQSWVVGTFSYSLPTTDVNGHTLRIKDILRITAYQDGTINAFTMSQLERRRMDALFPIRSALLPRRPAYYTVYSGMLELDSFPNAQYDATYYVTGWPSRITINQTQPYADEFDDVIEAFATADVFASLQLSDDANNWMQLAELRLKETLYAVNQKSDWEASLSPDSYRVKPYGYGGNPGTDPFVKRM